MHLLLDTHALLWFVDDSPQLGANAKQAIIDPHNKKYVSWVSYWELAIKLGNGRLSLDIDLAILMDQVSSWQAGFLSLDAKAILTLRQLPHHHRDPFDRMLVAQALCHNLTLVTRDPALSPYEVPILW